jgi:hypothetical protein
MNISFKEFQKNAVIRYLSLDKYQYIRERLYQCDVSKDEEFQKTFDAFYRVRRNKEWRNKFFEYFEETKNRRGISFKEILRDLFLRTGNTEASFASKMLATINPNMPIWDQYVLQSLDLKVEGTEKDERLKSTIDTYDKIIQRENELLKQPEIQEEISKFKDCFSKYDISDIKILDYMLWSDREAE